eukprot:scaffold157858_cov27-Prasinocladus_malaysianus.AAC.2
MDGMDNKSSSSASSRPTIQLRYEYEHSRIQDSTRTAYQYRYRRTPYMFASEAGDDESIIETRTRTSTNLRRMMKKQATCYSYPYS